MTEFWDKHPDFPKTETYRNNLQNCPHICFKIPTAGGKTYLACNTIEPFFNKLRIDSNRMVVWLVPSKAILEQTYKNLNNPRHFYRQKLNQDFGKNRIHIYTIDDLLEGANNFNPIGVQENVSILVLSYQSIRADKQTKENRRVYRENSMLATFFEGNTDKDFLLEGSEIEEKSLINVIRKFRPFCIIDEAHNATSKLSVQMLQNVNPSFVLELTATPRTLKKGKKEIEISNILSYVDSFALKQENMVKLPVLVQNLQSRKEVLKRAIALQKELQSKTKGSKDYIRPIVLCQAQPKNNKDSETFEKIKADLITLGISESHIAIKTANKDEIKNVNLLAKNCKIRYIITVDALKEGWDCPFAYILATVANKTSKIVIEQIVGRILRKPYTKALDDAYLNMSYILTSSNKFQDVLDKIVQALNGQGFEKEDLKKVENPDSPLFQEPQNQSDHEIDTTQDEHITGADEVTEADYNFVADNENSVVFVRDFMEQAQTISEQDKITSEAISQSTIKPIPSDLKNKVSTYSMKKDYEEIATKIRLPQFFIEIPALSVFENTKEDKLSVEYLLQGFDLSKQSIDIDFDKIEIDLHEIDVLKSKGEALFARTKAQKLRQEQFLKLFTESSQENKVKMVVRALSKNLGNIPPFEERELTKYLTRLVESFDVERMNYAVSDAFGHAEKIKIFIRKLSNTYTQKHFYHLIEKDRIYTKDSYQLPEFTTAREKATIQKSLYERTEDLNSLEGELIADIVRYENVLFWHKFGNRGKQNFAINGCFINHYPDFLIVTERGKKIIVETKGRQLENSENADKIRLGNQWAQLAGRDYKYYMVFKDKEVDGCQTFDSFKDILQDL